MYGHADSFLLVSGMSTASCVENDLRYDGLQTGIHETGVEITGCTLKCVIEVFTSEMRGKNVEHQINLFIQNVIYCWNNAFFH